MRALVSEAIRNLDDIKRIEQAPYDEFMPYQNTYQALAASARTHAGRPALTYWHDHDTEQVDTTWSYQELLNDIHRAMQLFSRLAAPEQPRVAMLLPAIPAAYVTLWAAEAVGRVCPINFLLNSRHVIELVRAAECNIVVALGECAELSIWPHVQALQKACPQLRAVVRVNPQGARVVAEPTASETVLDFWRELNDMPNSPPPEWREPNRETVAAYFHTGGTTGTPKLVQHLHRNQLHAARGAMLMYGTTHNDSIINGFPLFHVAGSMVYGLSTLMAGGRIFLPTLLGFRHSKFMQNYWAFVERYGISLATAVPTGIATLMAVPHQPQQRRSVRAMITGGSPLPEAIADECEQKLGIPVRNTLGMTESAGVISIEPVAAPRQTDSCGWRLPFSEVRICHPDTSEPLANGEIGVLQLRGPNVSPGYLNSAQNKDNFQDGWLVSGDLAQLSENERIHVRGRSKDIIIRNSHNIDPQQIEDVLMSHPDVQLAAVVGQPDEYAGELPAAFVVFHANVQPDLGALRRYAEEHVAERPAWPKHYEIVSTLPQTAVGKVYKPELRRLAIERVFNERLAARDCQAAVQVSCEEAGGGFKVVFTVTANAEQPFDLLQKHIAQMMRPFALPHEIRSSHAAPAHSSV